MRIALVHNFFYEGSGASSVVLHAASQLKMRGHDVEVFVLGAEDGVSGDYTNLSFRQWRVNNIRFLSFFDPLLLLANKVRAAFLFRSLAGKINRDFDVVVTSHYYLTPLLHFFSGKPCVYYCHEPPRQYYEPFFGGGKAFKSFWWRIIHPLDFLYGLVDKFLDMFCVRKAAVIASNSDYTRDLVEDIYGRDAVTVYPGVDANVFKDLKLEKDIVLSVGRLYLDLKGHGFVIQSLGSVKGEKPPLVVVGDGTDKEREALVKLAGECGVSLEIKPSVSLEELVRLYCRARACVFGYVREPLGLTALEAMACGAPVVAVSEGGLAEAVGDGGVLVERDETKFAGALESVLNNPGKASELGASGRRRIEEYFTWDVFGGKLEQVILKVGGVRKD